MPYTEKETEMSELLRSVEAQLSQTAVDEGEHCLGRTMMDQSESMVLYALGAGVRLPASLLSVYFELRAQAQASPDGSLDPARLTELAEVHASLSETIAPATPRAVSLMRAEKEKHPILSGFGPVPIVRQLLLVAGVSTAVMLLVALSPSVNPITMQRDLLESSGWNLLVCEIFLVAASALGSSFSALFKLNRYITKGAYDPRYESTYWIQLVLGVISGIVLSQIIFHSMEAKNGTARHRIFDQPILALLGGFSSALVYRILNRILTAVESLFGSDRSAGDAFADLQRQRLRTPVPRRPIVAAAASPSKNGASKDSGAQPAGAQPAAES